MTDARDETAPIAATTGTNNPTTPSSTRPLRKQTVARPRITITTAAVPKIEAGSSSPNGFVPTTTNAANALATSTASSEVRPLLGPVDILEAHPKGELVQGEAHPDAEGNGHDVPPRILEWRGERKEAGDHHQTDAPDQVMDVYAAALDPTRPPRNAPGQPRAGSDRKEGDQERDEHHERRTGPGSWSMAERSDTENRRDQHREQAYRGAGSSMSVRVDRDAGGRLGRRSKSRMS